MAKWVCSVCGYEYDPADGTPAGAPFEELPADWVCPVCGAGKDVFEKQD
ncbi:MAG: rubredoxin [Firmicutes bacterium]|nr:rubredoxin [Bacillota bacterium]